MDVFDLAAGAGADFLRAAAIDAAYELGVFDALVTPQTFDALADRVDVRRGRWRLRALVDALVALGSMRRSPAQLHAEGVLSVVAVPPRSVVPRAGWGLLADVIRTGRPLPVERGAAERRLHAHLATAGAAAAAEVVDLLADAGAATLVDLGGGAGAYAGAFIARVPGARVTLVDVPEVVALAQERLPAEHADFVASDIRTATLPRVYDAALLANVLHLHDPPTCAALCVAAARAVTPGGVVAIKDLRVDDGRAGPLEGLLFALNMAVYTEGGDVYETSRLRAWLQAAGLVDITEHRLESSPNAIVVLGRRAAAP